MAQGFCRILEPAMLTLVVNVGDDDYVYGAYVAADLDTVTYTLAGIQGRQGWGLADDTFEVMAHLDAIGVDTSFRLGDRDLAHCLARTEALLAGEDLSVFTTRFASHLGAVLAPTPASNDRIRTRIRTEEGRWLDFQEYFVRRGHRDTVKNIAYEGVDDALPTTGVVEAIEAADLVVIAPSNPPLSILPMLAMPLLRSAVEAHPRVVAVSPFFSGKALKGPAAEVMDALGYGAGTPGLLQVYDGIITDLVVDDSDAGDVLVFANGPVRLHATDTRIAQPDEAERLAKEILSWTR